MGGEMVGSRSWGLGRSRLGRLGWWIGVVLWPFSLDGIDLVALDCKLDETLGKRLTLDI